MASENFLNLDLPFICNLKPFTCIDLGIAGYTAQLMAGPMPYDALIKNHQVLRVADADDEALFFVTLESNPSSSRKMLCIQTEKRHQSQVADRAITRWTQKAFMAAALPMAKAEVTAMSPKAPAKRKGA